MYEDKYLLVNRWPLLVRKIKKIYVNWLINSTKKHLLFIVFSSLLCAYLPVVFTSLWLITSLHQDCISSVCLPKDYTPPFFLMLLSIINHMVFIYQLHLLISAPCVQKFPSDRFQTSSWWFSCLVVCLFGIGDYINSFCFQYFCTNCGVIRFRLLSIIPSLLICFSSVFSYSFDFDLTWT